MNKTIILALAAGAVLATACTPLAPSVSKKEQSSSVDLDTKTNTTLTITQPATPAQLNPIFSDYLPILLNVGEAASDKIPLSDNNLTSKMRDRLIDRGFVTFRLRPEVRSANDPKDRIYVVFVVDLSRRRIDYRVSWDLAPTLRLSPTQIFQLSLVEKDKENEWLAGNDTKLATSQFMLEKFLKEVRVYYKSDLNDAEIAYLESKGLRSTVASQEPKTIDVNLKPKEGADDSDAVSIQVLDKSAE